jgi:hypothetical protein
MADNGSNSWGVSYGRIMFLDQILRNHSNVSSVSRSNDILFTVNRKRPGDTLSILCVDEYAFGIAMAHRALDEFRHLDIIFVGGKWNHATGEAVVFLRDRKIGVYNAKDINGALQSKTYWKYNPRS